MSYLTSYATRHLPTQAGGTAGVRVDEDRVLNLEGHHGAASIRVFVEDTTCRRWRKRPPEPGVRLRISDCAQEISLWFEVTSPERRENALRKIDTLHGSLTRFRSALEAECELYEQRCRHSRR